MQQLGQSLGLSLPGGNGSEDRGQHNSQPTVLQSLHTPMPLPREPSKDDSAIAKIISEAEQGSSTTTRRTKEQADLQVSEKDAGETKAPSHAEVDSEPPGDLPFGLHIPNPFFHFFHPAAKAADGKEQIASSTPVTDAAPAETTKPAKQTKRKSKKIESIKKPEQAEKAEKKEKKKRKVHHWFGNVKPEQGAEHQEAKADDSIASILAKDEPLTTAPTPLDSSKEASSPTESDLTESKTLAPVQEAVSPGKSFQIPALPSSSRFFTPLKNAAKQAEQDAPPQAKLPPDSNEPWSIRLRYLADHGTGTLKDGEAFMFSEDTGEATLFLADGKTVRRTIYFPRDAQEVVRERRPDMLIPDDLMYNLSLLAKLIPKQPEPVSAAAAGQPAQPASTFDASALAGSSDNFWSWLKNTIKF